MERKHNIPFNREMYPVETKIPSLKIKKLFEDSVVPQRSFPTDSGLDLYAYRVEKVYDIDGNHKPSMDLSDSGLCVYPQSRVLVNTGIAATVGPGYEIQIRPRSGLALKNGLTVLNTPGTVDESYRGTISVIIANTSNEPYIIKKNDRIAQLVVCPVVLCEVEEIDDLTSTERGAGGFGHTGD